MLATTPVMTPVAMEVAAVQRELADTVTLTLTPPGGTFPFEPGQFNMLYAMGLGEIPISISGDPNTPQQLVHTIRAVGNASRSLTVLKTGSRVGVRGPFGSPWPLEKAKGKDVLVITGGIGLAPLRPLLFQLMAQPDQFGRLVLLHGARTPADILFFDQLKSWKAASPLHVRLTVDQAGADWESNLGPVTKLISARDFDPTNLCVFICGPEIMMRFVLHILLGMEVDTNQIFLSMERNMKCAVGHCGHCQFGAHFVCRDGPVFAYGQIRNLLAEKER